MGQKLLSPWKPLFLEMFVSIDPLGPKKNDLIFCTMTMLVKAPLCAYRFFAVVCHVKYYEKKQVKVFFTWKIASFQKFAFSSTSWVQKNAIIKSTIIVRIAFEPLQIINGGLSHSIMREKMGQKLLPREDSLFLKNLVLDFLGPKETVISLAQN